jgi:hypothetical protein
MIVSSQVDLVCWTGRVGFVCRDCREALTTVTPEKPPDLETCSDRGATGMPSLQRFAPTIRGTMPDPSMTAAAASHWQRYDFRCGSNSEVQMLNR